MIYSITKFKGLNLRDSDLNRAKEYASDLINVRLDKRSAVVKRNGTDEVNTQLGIIDIITYNNETELIAITQTELLKLNEGTLLFEPIENDWDDVTTPLNYTVAISHCEYNNVLYIADPAGIEEIMKYDGSKFYRAGLQKPDVTTVVPAGAGVTTYLRLHYEFIDRQDNVVKGDFYQSALIDRGAGAAGDVTITFDATNISSVTDKYKEPYPASPLITLEVYASSTESFGYYYVGTEPVDNTTGSQIVVISGVNIDGAISSRLNPMEDAYDTTIVKGAPPKSSYIAIYNNIMVAAVDNSAVITGITKYNDRIFWSDLSVGSTVETFAPFDTDQVGDTGEGGISGIFPSKECLTVFKFKAVYHVSGNLPQKQYRIINALAMKVGCVSHKSIAEALGGCVFSTVKGIYFVSGISQPVELSDIIEPYFDGVDMSDSRIVVDYLGERFYCYIPSVDQHVMYDYYYKEFFLYDQMNASNGFVYYKGEKYLADAAGLDVTDNTYNDKGVAIAAKYVTSWFNEGIPSLVKKYVDLMIFSLTGAKNAIKVVTSLNWVFATESTDSEIDFKGSTVNADNLNLSGDNTKSIAFSLSNDELDENMVITGISIDIKANQKDFKGE